MHTRCLLQRIQLLRALGYKKQIFLRTKTTPDSHLLKSLFTTGTVFKSITLYEYTKATQRDGLLEGMTPDLG